MNLKILPLLAMAFTATEVKASDCDQLSRALADASSECEAENPNSDLDAYSQCFNRKIVEKTGLGLGAVENKLAKCGGR